jgi:hypothetical protein
MGGVDPFDAFGLLKNPTTDMALHHCERPEEVRRLNSARR